MKKRIGAFLLAMLLTIIPMSAASATQVNQKINQHSVEFVVPDIAANEDEDHFTFTQTVFVDDNGNVYQDGVMPNVSGYLLSLEFYVTWKGSYLKNMSWAVESTTKNLKFVTGDVDIFADYSMIGNEYFHSDLLSGMYACYGPVDGSWYIPNVDKVEIQVLWNVDTITQNHVLFKSYFPVHK